MQLIGYICAPTALDWVDEFLAYPPTANGGMGLVDQALFWRVIYPDDPRLGGWLRAADSIRDPYIQDAVRRIREDAGK